MEKFILCQIEGEIEKKNIEFASGVSQHIDPFDFEKIKTFETLIEAEIALKKTSKSDFLKSERLHVLAKESFILKTDKEEKEMLDFYYGNALDIFIQNKIVETLEDAERNGDDLGDNARIVKEFLNGNLLGFSLNEKFRDFILETLNKIQQ